jgi:hypothetical protein
VPGTPSSAWPASAPLEPITAQPLKGSPAYSDISSDGWGLALRVLQQCEYHACLEGPSIKVACGYSLPSKQPHSAPEKAVNPLLPCSFEAQLCLQLQSLKNISGEMCTRYLCLCPVDSQDWGARLFLESKLPSLPT